MYRRLAILSVIILVALCGFGAVGFYAIARWAEGLQGSRLGEFAAVAEQVRLDVRHKLDQFIKREQERPYTDYLYYHVPADQPAVQQQAVTLVRSPLSGSLDHGLAYGHFQVQPDGTIMTPNDDLLHRQGTNEFNYAVSNDLQPLKEDIRTKLLPLFRTGATAQISQTGPSAMDLQSPGRAKDERQMPPVQAKAAAKGKEYGRATKSLAIESLQNTDQRSQVTQMDRQVVYDNLSSNTGQVPRAYSMDPQGPWRPQAENQARQSTTQSAEAQTQTQARPNDSQVSANRTQEQLQAVQMPEQAQQTQVLMRDAASPGQVAAQAGARQGEDSTVTVRIEPLVPIVVRGTGDPCSIFDGLVYMIRHVQVAQEHLVQGFRLDLSRLRAEVEDSAQRLVRNNMGFELSSTESDGAAYTAILDFGFGNLVLNLMEKDPGWISHRVDWLHRWYFGTMAVVILAVGLGLVSLWHGAWQQIRLARQKDDFISAVSHELRTPLTSIRMYAEMLEKGWIKSGDKQDRYYGSIRQESERLSRLIENVLDFSRIQRGRKNYHFALGDINAVVTQVVEMMRPYASQHGFDLRTDLAALEAVTFDRDAVTQIVVNLLDNAVKFARSAQDKTIVVRTRTEDGHTLIEVEDHGPGVPHAERGRIFEEFYRIERESTRQTTGTGLGLALVRGFALAHQGFVRVTEAHPQGAIFTVGLGKLTAN